MTEMSLFFVIKKRRSPEKETAVMLSSGCNKEIGMNKNGSHTTIIINTESYTLKQYRTEV